MTDAYNPASRPCSGHVTSGLTTLHHSTLGYWPAATNVGTYMCRPTADGDPSVHGNGRAGDIGCRGALGAEIAGWLVANHTVLGVQLVIWNHRIWTLAKGWHVYGCDRPGSKKDHHTTHVHYEINIDAASRLTPQIVDSVHPHPPTPEPEEQVSYIYLDKTGQDQGQVYSDGTVLVKIPTGEDAQACRDAGAKEVKLSHAMWSIINDAAQG